MRPSSAEWDSRQSFRLCTRCRVNTTLDWSYASHGHTSFQHTEAYAGRDTRARTTLSSYGTSAISDSSSNRKPNECRLPCIKPSSISILIHLMIPKQPGFYPFSLHSCPPQEEKKAGYVIYIYTHTRGIQWHFIYMNTFGRVIT